LIYDNGDQVARVVANAYRADLETAGIGRGRHAFDHYLTPALPSLVSHAIRVVVEADGTELGRSPAVIEASGGFGPEAEAAVARAIAALAAPSERARALAFLGAQAEVLLHAQADDASQRVERAAYQRLVRRLGPASDGIKGPGTRALVIDTRVPVEGRDAGSQAVLSHMRSLKRLGHAVSLVAADEMDIVDGPDGTALCHAPWYASVEEVLQRQAGCFDVVYLHRAMIAANYLNLVRRHQPRARILYSVADLHHVRMERQAAAEERPELVGASRVMRLLECTAAWSADAVLSHSAFEVELLRRAVPQARCYLAPWALPVRAGKAGFAARSGVAFIGGFGHEPNLDAAYWLLDEVMPLVWASAPEIALHLVGSDLPAVLQARASNEGASNEGASNEGALNEGALNESKAQRVVVRGHVADLAGEVLGRVRLTVAPLRFGAGVKGKVLESLAAGVPCVMSAIAAEGMLLPPALQALVGADAAAIAALIVALHGDGRAHGRAAKAGIALMRAAFSEAAVDAALGAAIEGRVV